MSIRLNNQVISGSISTSEINSLIDAKLSAIDTNPVGSIIPYGGSTAPDGYLICDGSAVSRTTYADLYAVIGTAYGEGDGNSSFNLPNLADRILQGPGERGTLGEALNESLPNITGEISGLGDEYGVLTASNHSGALKPGKNTQYSYSGIKAAGTFLAIDASLASSTYQDNAPVQQNAVICNYIVKY